VPGKDDAQDEPDPIDDVDSESKPRDLRGILVAGVGCGGTIKRAAAAASGDTQSR